MLRYATACMDGDEAAGRWLYLSTGRQIADAVLQVAELGLGGPARVRAMLDFASGFGRSTRFLLSAIPAERLTVCDIQAEGVAFQQATFGVDGVVSSPVPEAVDLAGPFDLVFAASFFTHAPPQLFGRWLGALEAVLADDGVLGFSTTDISTADRAAPGAEVHFGATSESAVLAAETYGTTWTSPAWVQRSLAPLQRSGDRVIRLPRGLCAHQDLWVLDRTATGASFGSFAFFPRGDVDRVQRQDQILVVGGWAEDCDPAGGRGRVRAVNQEGDELASVAVELAPGSTARWDLELEAEALDPDSLVGIEAVNRGGRSKLIGLGTLRRFAPS